MPRKTVLIYDGDDNERLHELRTKVAIAERAEEAAAERASKAGPRRFGESVPDEVAEAKAVTKAAQDDYDAYVDVAAERAEEWVVESLGFKAWRGLLAAHPPRKVTVGEGDAAKEVVHPDDDGYEANTETFPEALLLFVDRNDTTHRTITKAGEHDLSNLAGRIDRLSLGQFETLWHTAYTLNIGGIADPKLGRFSPDGRKSDET